MKKEKRKWGLQNPANETRLESEVYKILLLFKSLYEKAVNFPKKADEDLLRSKTKEKPLQWTKLLWQNLANALGSRPSDSPRVMRVQNSSMKSDNPASSVQTALSDYCSMQYSLTTAIISVPESFQKNEKRILVTQVTLCLKIVGQQRIELSYSYFSPPRSSSILHWL